MKTCTRCGRLLPLSNFHRDKISEDGHYYVCKECRRRLYYEERGGIDKQLRRFSTEDLRKELARRDAEAASAD